MSKSKLIKKESKTKSDPRPFLKWAGGKGQLLSTFKKFYPDNFDSYYEPFVGGGAVFFNVLPEEACLNDINKDLIQAYRHVKNNLEELIVRLKKLEEEYLNANKEDRKDFFYKMRTEYNSLEINEIERTARLFFLNKTCFNGMYRVNSSGEFNVPHGRYKNPTILDEENLHIVSSALKDVEFMSKDFIKAVEGAREDDFVYLDPPYHPLDNESNFTSYSEEGFGIEDQKRLGTLFKELDKRGCYVMLSNSYTDFIKDLYSDYRQETVKAKRFVNCNGEDRGDVKELLVLNY